MIFSFPGTGEALQDKEGLRTAGHDPEGPPEFGGRGERGVKTIELVVVEVESFILNRK